MSGPGPPAAGSRFRLAELMAAISLATDLGMGQPLEQALRTCLVAVGLGREVGLRQEELSDVYYVAMLRYLGCTADAYETARLVGGDDIDFRLAVAPVYGAPFPEFMLALLPSLARNEHPVRRATTVARFMATGAKVIRHGVAAHCEVADRLAGRIGLGDGVRRGLGHAFERWNGKGFPSGLKGDDIALPARVVTVARDAEVLERALGQQDTIDVLRRRRSAGTYDPELVDAFVAHGPTLLEPLRQASLWDATLAEEPEPYPWIPGSRLDAVLEAFADFADLKSPFTIGHSRGVADLVAAACSTEHRSELRRAALLHDLGRVSVPTGVWDRRGPLSQGDWERVRLHPYYTERILSRSPTLEPLAVLAAMHHERLDGSGYHRACRGGEMSAGARLIAAADAFQAMTQARPHRLALAPGEARRLLLDEALAGRLDQDAVEAVLTAGGQAGARVRREWPAGLTEREVEVLRLLCRGATKKQVAAELHISASTADHHVRHIYEKTEASTRAGAAVFALEHGLIPK